MLSRVVLTAQRHGATVTRQLQRNLGVSAVVAQKAATAQDPIQQLFVSKIRDYAKQSQAAGGKIVGATPDVEQRLQDQLDRITVQYGATGPDFLKFPTFSFTDPTLEPVGVNVEAKEASTPQAEEVVVEDKDADRVYWEL